MKKNVTESKIYQIALLTQRAIKVNDPRYGKFYDVSGTNVCLIHSLFYELAEAEPKIA